jgi:hypothetical protein
VLQSDRIYPFNDDLRHSITLISLFIALVVALVTGILFGELF